MQMDQSMSVRNYLETLLEITKVLAGKTYRVNNFEHFQSLFLVNLFSSNNDTLYGISATNFGFSEKDLIEFRVRSALLSITLVSDLYIWLSHCKKLEKLDNNDAKILREIITSVEKNDFELLLSNVKTISKFVEATREFRDGSALYKVQLIKSLNEEDLEILKFNPLFEQEYNHYNVEVTNDFVLRHIAKWIKQYNFGAAKARMADFLVNLYIFNPDNLAGIDLGDYTLELIKDGNKDELALELDKFYEENKDILKRKQ